MGHEAVSVFSGPGARSGVAISRSSRLKTFVLLDRRRHCKSLFDRAVGARAHGDVRSVRTRLPLIRFFVSFY